jgi:uncharacterized membrane protein (DUF485 family)
MGRNPGKTTRSAAPRGQNRRRRVPKNSLQKTFAARARRPNIRGAMSHPTPPPDDAVHSESFLHLLMRRQFRLSAVCAAAFLVVLLGLPLANYFAPALMATRIGGFTLSWFILGVLFFPAVWAISWFFIKRSSALEAEEVAQVERDRKGGGA